MLYSYGTKFLIDIQGVRDIDVQGARPACFKQVLVRKLMNTAPKTLVR
jgi:hypothetical protein